MDGSAASPEDGILRSKAGEVEGRFDAAMETDDDTQDAATEPCAKEGRRSADPVELAPPPRDAPPGDDLRATLMSYVQARTDSPLSSSGPIPPPRRRGHSPTTVSAAEENLSSEETEPNPPDPLPADMTALRQRTLRETAEYDRIGGAHVPVVCVPTELLTKLKARRAAVVQEAQDRRAGFEKFQDFDAFIDELTLTDEHSWKEIQLTKPDPKTLFKKPSRQD